MPINYQNLIDMSQQTDIWTTMGARDIHGEPVGAQRTPTLEHDEETADQSARQLVEDTLAKMKVRELAGCDVKVDGAGEAVESDSEGLVSSGTSMLH